MIKKIKNVSRRDFIRQGSCAAIGGTTFLSTLLNLKTLGSSAVHNSSAIGGGYKAIVCLMLSGGNDSFNMLIPTESNEYNIYSNTRSNLAIPANDILGINPTNTGSRTFGVHPSMPRVQSMFDSGKLSFISNVGTLIHPITKSEFYNGTVQTPLGLYSHSDQLMHWQTGIPHDRTPTGWGGKIADLLHAGNVNQNLSMNMSLSGTNVWQTGNSSVEFSLNPNPDSGPVTGIHGDNDDWLVNTVRKNALNSMVDTNYFDVYMNGYKDVIKTARVGTQQLEAALASTPTYNVPFTTETAYPYLSQSFKVVADVISARTTLGMNRQTFMIDFGGWDHHDELTMSQADMLTRVDNALYEFNAAMEQLGLADCVTTFVVSEFGRTLTSNGNGSDHGWGGNVLAMGGAVNGQQIYGNYPILDLDGNLEIGGGVYIPTTATDEYFAELAMWFGVPDSELGLLFPNLSNFYSVGSGNPIGFMNI